MLIIEQIPVGVDNYVYVIRDEATGLTAVVDPAEAAPVLELLERRSWPLDYILNTHHHPDHVGGNRLLQERTGCAVVGAAKDALRIPGISVKVTEGDRFALGESEAMIFEVHGHTRGHIAYWFTKSQALFCGDTIFSLGCGKLFEGTPQEMWSSLSKLRKLPGSTRIYCAHEYTLDNARFALIADPENFALQAFVRRAGKMRAEGKPTVPSLLSDECAVNPFLRPESQAIQDRFHVVGRELWEIFGEIRRRKDLLDSGLPVL